MPAAGCEYLKDPASRVIKIFIITHDGEVINLWVFMGVFSDFLNPDYQNHKILRENNCDN